ncbi:MAG: hypothetical protein IJS90_05755 [Clostridia bacterium]|nr:hypothetical protein [Clostridia bacterium]
MMKTTGIYNKMYFPVPRGCAALPVRLKRKAPSCPSFPPICLILIKSRFRSRWNDLAFFLFLDRANNSPKSLLYLARRYEFADNQKNEAGLYEQICGISPGSTDGLACRFGRCFCLTAEIAPGDPHPHPFAGGGVAVRRKAEDGPPNSRLKPLFYIKLLLAARLLIPKGVLFIISFLWMIPRFFLFLNTRFCLLSVLKSPFFFGSAAPLRGIKTGVYMLMSHI